MVTSSFNFFRGAGIYVECALSKLPHYLDFIPYCHISQYWVINRSEYYRQQVFQAVENDKAQFASDNDTAIIQYIE